MESALQSIGRLGAFLLLLAIALLVCAAYGALHDQVSYTVSPEYYTRFKFEQFGFARDTPTPPYWIFLRPIGGPRFWAAMVGVGATLWMGLPIGGTLGAIALFARDHRAMLRETVRAYGIVLAVAALFGLGGLLVGMLLFHGADDAPEWVYFPQHLADPAAFLRAGAMHDASYLGGAVGTLAAAIWLARRVTALRYAASRATPAAR